MVVDFLNQFSLPVGLFIFSLLTVSFGLAIYLIAHYLIRSYIVKSHERVGRVLFRVGASLLGLILSITFANQRVEYFKIKDGLEREAAKLVSIHNALGLFETEQAEEIQLQIRDYISITSESGWDYLYDNPFDAKTFVMFDQIYKSLYSLETNNDIQEKVKANIINDARMVFDYLQIRLYSTRPESQNLIYTTVFGLIIIMILFSVYKPDLISLSFLGLYVMFIGVVLYFILMMTYPLRGPLQIEAGPFNLLREIIEQNF